MKFELFPIIDAMLDLYAKPRSPERFQQYISMLQGDTKGDLSLPISGFNPMAKEHVSQKLMELKELHAEHVIQETINEINRTLAKDQNQNQTTFKVVLNLADDLKGAWTNFYTTDYDSKFKINALVARAFCTPHFWTSETYTTQSIMVRASEYAFRTVYWLANPKPKTLKDHINQEIYVAEMSNRVPSTIESLDFDLLNNFFKEHRESEDYGIIFNFFYGDDASKSLEFAAHGIDGKATGFDYARVIQNKQVHKKR